MGLLREVLEKIPAYEVVTIVVPVLEIWRRVLILKHVVLTGDKALPTGEN